LRGLKFIEFKFKPIGIVHSPFKRNEDIDVRKFAGPQGFDQIQGELEMFKEHEEGLKDTEGFSYLIVNFAFQNIRISFLESHEFRAL
jgi:tRNA (Thr-GGU) A37 N-methylase